MQLPLEIQKLFAGFHQADLQRESDAARADPLKHKLSKVYENGRSMSYRYYSAKDGRGREIRFCWAVHRNVAGYFLFWRETINKAKTKAQRDQWGSRKRKKDAVAMCIKRRARLKARQP